MPFFGGFVSLAFFALWIYCLFDAISTDESVVRNLPKIAWVLIVIFLPPVGSIAWLLLGRPEGAAFKLGNLSRPESRPRRPLGPDDSPEFLSSIGSDAERLRRWEEDLKRREDELRRREEDES